MIRSLRFTRLVARTGDVVSHLQRMHFSNFHPPDPAWQPDVNVYAWPDRLEVCVDLAGVDRQDISVEVSPRRIVIRGHRVLPLRDAGAAACARILMMEIAAGEFERRLDLPVDVDTQDVEARLENGWLWIAVQKAQQETV